MTKITQNFIINTLNTQQRMDYTHLDLGIDYLPYWDEPTDRDNTEIETETETNTDIELPF